jgi:hypothetical protein
VPPTVLFFATATLLHHVRAVLCCPGGFFSLCAALALYMFFWQFPSPGTPLFLADEGPVAVLLKQARGGGMVLAGESDSATKILKTILCRFIQSATHLLCVRASATGACTWQLEQTFVQVLPGVVYAVWHALNNAADSNRLAAAGAGAP